LFASWIEQGSQAHYGSSDAQADRRQHDILQEKIHTLEKRTIAHLDQAAQDDDFTDFAVACFLQEQVCV